MKSLSRVKKQKRKQTFKKILSIIIVICTLGMITTFPMIWWFFRLELVMIKYFLTFLFLTTICLTMFEIIERR